MALNVGKIIDGLKLSYGQLRNLLITSIGAVATVWIVGNKVGSMTTQMDILIQGQNQIKTEVANMKTITENGLNRIYTDFAAINATNNELWNSKFELLLEYGDGNKELLKKLLDYEDKRAEAARQEIETNKNYSIQAEPVKKNESQFPNFGGAMFISLDENGNPVDTVMLDSKGDTINKKEELSISVRKKEGGNQN
jgi:hypothetical protein